MLNANRAPKLMSFLQARIQIIPLHNDLSENIAAVNMNSLKPLREKKKYFLLVSVWGFFGVFLLFSRSLNRFACLIARKYRILNIIKNSKLFQVQKNPRITEREIAYLCYII